MLHELTQAFLPFDEALFVRINQQWTDPALDLFFSTLTNFHHTKVFLYVLAPIILFLWWYKARRHLFAILFAAGFTVLISDTICYRVIKEYTFRERPFANAQLNAEVRVGYRPQSSSFPSNHAVNTFAVATLLTWYYPQLWMLFFLIASLVAYSRVYVGVHYPFDVFIGAILGVLVAAFLVRLVFDRFIPLKPTYEVNSQRGVYKPSARLKKFFKLKARR